MATAGFGARGKIDPPNARPSNLSTGAAGEHLVRAVLENVSVATASTPDGLGYDIAAYADRWFRVQVKATTVKSKDGRYQFATRRNNDIPLTIKDCDIVAFVAMPLRLVLFRNVSVVRGKTFKLPPSKFTPEAERTSWEQAIK